MQQPAIVSPVNASTMQGVFGRPKGPLAQYGYDAATGQLNDLTVSANGLVVAGARIDYDGGVQVRQATLHAVSNETRANEYDYGLRGCLQTSKFAREQGAPASTEHLDPADFRSMLELPEENGLRSRSSGSPDTRSRS